MLCFPLPVERTGGVNSNADHSTTNIPGKSAIPITGMGMKSFKTFSVQLFHYTSIVNICWVLLVVLTLKVAMLRKNKFQNNEN